MKTKNYSAKDAIKDSLIGILLALVSIPISMGYANIAGLPVEYGLYGSVIPVLAFGLLTSSKKFVFGVDAAPAALTGVILVNCNIAFESKEALSFVPLITLLVSLWLFLFWIFKANRILKFVSESVMAGFITGISVTIIFMQLPKLFGGNAGSGEIIQLIQNIIVQRESFNLASLVLGLSTIALILIFKKLLPKFPIQIILMIVFAIIQKKFNLSQFGIKCLQNVESAFPKIKLPDIRLLHKHFYDIILPSLSIAVVIFSETLLATSNNAKKNEYKINPGREILAYSVSNFSAALFGTCPVNGSISRTSIANQFGVKSQLMTITSSLTMFILLCFATSFIQYLPVPLLTGIIISALYSTLEFKFAHKLHKADKTEFFIFYAAFLTVIFLGTIYGVITGVLLSTITFIIRQSKPSVDFLGVVPGMKGYYSLTRKNSYALPIKNVLIYRFSGPLFYANCEKLYDDILSSLKEDTKIVIIDSSAISSIDITAAQYLDSLYKKLISMGKIFFIAGHVSSVNDQLREFGYNELIEKRIVKPKLAKALDDAGLKRPYPHEDTNSFKSDFYTKEIAEFEWAYGKAAENLMESSGE